MPARRFLLLFNTRAAAPPSSTVQSCTPHFRRLCDCNGENFNQRRTRSGLGWSFAVWSGCQPALALNLVTPSNASSSSSAPSSSSSASAARLRSHCAHTWPGPGQFERTKARGWAAAIKQLWHESAKEAGGSQ